MTDYRGIALQLTEALGLTRRPVAVAFLMAPPAGIAKFEGVMPSGCSFWRLAADGRTFYTIPGDHYNCPVGSYTHNIALPPDRAPELEQTLSLMATLGYVKMEEVPGIPRLPEEPGAILYAPLGDTPVDPDVVIFAGRPARLMQLIEAALRAGVMANAPLLPRPTCMALPAALAHGVVTSSGCIGNRVYTDLGDDELYTVVPGRELQRVADALRTIVTANAQLADYHRGRRESLATA
ncbi:MAG TPA: DUF169 domain-containing protein [Bryobacteraceae bacterium]|jgi:uncharacterized protein (DUF169 family)|nr:DUF169 domain-containing protein [Bryobacteraceae bacterium]